MKDQSTLWVALIAAGCFVVACVTGLSALGRDATQVLYLLSAVVPSTIASLAALRASNRAKNSADNAADISINAAEHAANAAAAQASLKSSVQQLQAQIGGRRANDAGPNL